MIGIPYRNIGLIAAVVAGLGLLDARPADGQGLGTVQRTVVDDGGGAALEGAVVVLEELGFSTTTGFVIDEIPAGDYTLTVTREGFVPLTSRVTVAAGPPVRLDLRLPAAQFEEQVVVTGVRSELALAEDTETGSRLGLSAMDVPASINVIDSSVMEARGYQRISDMVETTPGVVVGQNPAAPSSFSMRGFTRSQCCPGRRRSSTARARWPARSTRLRSRRRRRRPRSGTPCCRTAASTLIRRRWVVNRPISDSLWYRLDFSRYGSDGHVERMRRALPTSPAACCGGPVRAPS